jgi:arylsulfatase A-like enzyme
MGYDIPAPNLMRLARQGVLFRHCFASAPSCAPSRAALVTGQYLLAEGVIPPPPVKGT